MHSLKDTTAVILAVVDNDTPTSRKNIRITEARKLLRNKKLKTDDEVIVPIDPSDFGRIAAQSARQMVMQQLRDAERLKIYTEFKDKVGQVFTGIVQRFEHRDVIMNIGKTEGVLIANDGEPRDDVFLRDGLHLNATGYAAWTRVVRAQLFGTAGK